MARRLLVHRNKSTGTAILDSILPCVRIGDEPVDKGAGRRYLHIFAVTAVEQFENTREIMDGLQFDGLVCECDFCFLVCGEVWARNDRNSSPTTFAFLYAVYPAENDLPTLKI